MDSVSIPPLVSIGLPVYNRPHLLRLALVSLSRQSYKNLEIIVSDDCSPGQETQKVVQEFVEKDSRIRYIRQRKNIGPILNHRFVFEKSVGEFFLWASEDDEWDEKFIEIGVQTLLANPACDAWRCSMKVVDEIGTLIYEDASFSRFTSTQNKKKDIVKYLLEPESMGKANIVLSLFRRDALSKTIKEYFWSNSWGTDMCFNLAFLTRYDLVASDEILFDKRDKNAVMSIRDVEHLEMVGVQKPGIHNFPLSEGMLYIKEYYKAVRTTRYKYLVVTIMLIRLLVLARQGFSFTQTIKMPIINFARTIKKTLFARG